MDTIAAVHGWEARSRRGFLGGIEPGSLLQSIRMEIMALNLASEDLEKADLLLELQQKREQMTALSEERDRLAEDMAQLREDNFEARDVLAGQTDELDRLRQLARERDLAQERETAASSGGGLAGGIRRRLSALSSLSGSDEPSSQDASADQATFKAALSRAQRSEGKRVVEALERLKLPDESSMGPRELACWHENKKTI
eukprot:808799-Prymnesium_polylepis.1